MLPSQYRIKKKKDFENILKRGQTIIGRFFFIKIIYKKRDKRLRFAFVFPIKLEKSACKRNRVKRLFREAVRQNIFNIKEVADIIFIIKKEAKNKNYFDIEKEIKIVFKKNKLLKQ